MDVNSLYISLWAYLFCMPLSEPGEVFSGIKAILNRICSDWLFKPLIGCPKCHAGWVAIGYETLHGLALDSILVILVAIGGAYALQTWHQVVEKYLNR